MSGRSGSWRSHLALVGVLALELGVAGSLHRSAAQLERVWRAGETGERIAALHVLTNRGEPSSDRFGQDFVRTLLAREDDRLAEMAFTHDVSRFSDPTVQLAYVLRPTSNDYPHWWRAYVIHNAKVGGGPRLTRRELAWFFEAVKEFSPPLDEVEAHVHRVRERARVRRAVLGLDPPD